MIIADPVVKAELSQDGYFMIGGNHTLDCTITGTENLNPDISYNWTQCRGTMLLPVGETSNRLSLYSLKLSQAGMYTCMVIVRSDYLKEPINETASTNLTTNSK